MAKANEEMVENSTVNNTTNSNSNSTTNLNGQPQNQNNSAISPEEIFSSLIEIPIIRPRRPRRRRSNYSI